MRIIKTNVVKKIPKEIIRKQPLFSRLIIYGLPIYFEFPEKDLRKCLKRLRRTVPQIKNLWNRGSWQRVIKTGELLLQNKEPNEIAAALGLALSTIKRYLNDLDGKINKI